MGILGEAMGIKLDGDVRSLETKVLFEIHHKVAGVSNVPVDVMLAAVTSLPMARKLAETQYKAYRVEIKMRPISPENRAVWHQTMQRMREWSE
jgi:hypothetical protein